ncbi:DUF6868 family protein, partial [Vibrio diabolicus]|uniref:DUF6868 family protein n=1 Tax=Vibrio diabolicus TaxID=50719 RepID=UPI002160665A
FSQKRGLSMDLELITEFFGWCAFINIAFLSLTTVLILTLKKLVFSYHGKLFNLPESKLNEIYFSYLGNYKVATLVFFIVPYLALKIMS